jgi:transcriptional regulator, merR family
MVLASGNRRQIEMMTIKQMSELTGVSARTLRYYDEIGLFCPTEKSKAGYRLYDEAAFVIFPKIRYTRTINTSNT